MMERQVGSDGANVAVCVLSLGGGGNPLKSFKKRLCLMLPSCYKMSDQALEETFGSQASDARLTFSIGHHNGSSLELGLDGPWKRSGIKPWRYS